MPPQLLQYNPDVYAPGAPYLDTILSNVPDTVGAAVSAAGMEARSSARSGALLPASSTTAI